MLSMGATDIRDQVCVLPVLIVHHNVLGTERDTVELAQQARRVDLGVIATPGYSRRQESSGTQDRAKDQVRVRDMPLVSAFDQLPAPRLYRTEALL